MYVMPVCASIVQRSVVIQPCDLRPITTENVCGIWTVSFSLPNQVLSFGSKYLSGLGELVILKNVNQTSFFMQVALKTSLEAA